MRFADIGTVALSISYIYDEFRKGKVDSAMFGPLASQSADAEYAIYHVLLRFGLYASGLSMLTCFCLLMINSRSGGTKLAEAKDAVIRVMAISVFIFSVTGLVTLVQSVAL